MMKFSVKISKVFGLTLLPLVFSTSLAAQTESAETLEIRQGAEKFLQTVQEEKWNEVYKCIAFVVHGKSKSTIKRAEELKKLDAEVKEEIAGLFKDFRALNLKKTIKIKFDEKDQSIALIEFANGNIEGFKMILINKEWLFAMEIFVD